MSLFSRTTDLATPFAELAENVQNQPFAVVNIEFSEQSGYMRPDRGKMDLHPTGDLFV
ncbi:MAG: hypothetical protein ABSG97_03605 [Sedimentisphaerales bacterium]|jgi:hypothetical protein